MVRHLAIVGATGAVGRELCTLLDERGISVGRLSLLASARGAGTRINVRGEEHVVFVLNAGQAKARKVILGLSNEHRVVVREGLRPGEQVLLKPPPPSQ